MRIIVIMAVAALSLSAGAAFARETAETPFPSQAIFNVPTQGPGAELLPQAGSQGGVQSSNGLPVGFAKGNGANEYQASVLAYQQRRAAHHAAVLMAEQDKANPVPHS